jgi:hypothetical protein
MLATRRQTEHRHQHQHPHPQALDIPRDQSWNSSTTAAILNNPQPIFNNTNLSNSIFSFGVDEPLFDYQPAQFNSSPSRPLMQNEQSNTWLSHGQLTPTSTTRAHHRESSLSSLGSAGPASPYTANTSNPQVVGDIYHDFQDFQQPLSKPITPIHTPK